MRNTIRIIICDDELRTREALNSLVSRFHSSYPADAHHDIQVIGNAVNGQEAVKMVAERHPDVVLMDARMPVMDGFEATRQIKGKWPHIKVILMTMYAGQQTSAKAAGADLFLLKGCPSENLLDAILTVHPDD